MIYIFNVAISLTCISVIYFHYNSQKLLLKNYFKKHMLFFLLVDPLELSRDDKQDLSQ